MDTKACETIDGDYNPRTRTCRIRHVDEVRRARETPNGWYRVPGMEGLSWSHYTKGKQDFILEGSEDEDRGMLELWVGDKTSGDSESISWHRKARKLEEAAEKWISKNLEGWE